MIVNRTSDLSFNAVKVRILANANKGNIYLKNQVMNMLYEQVLPGTFLTNSITLPYVTKEALKQLKEYGINFEIIA